MMSQVAPLALTLLALAAHIPPVSSYHLPRHLNTTVPPFANGTHANKTASLRPPAPTLSLDHTKQEVAEKPVGPYFYQSESRLPTRVCGPTSSFSNTSSESALTADCLELAAAADDEAHSLLAYGFADNHTLLGVWNHGTCNFGIRPAAMEDVHSHRSFQGWWIGNRNIADYIRQVAGEYDVDGHLGASGRAACEWNQHHMDIHWTIYGPEQKEKVSWNWAPPAPGAAGRNAADLSVVLVAAVAWLAFFW